MNGAQRQNKPSEEVLRSAFDLFPNLFNCSWYTSGGSGDLSESAIAYADVIIRRLEEFKKLQREEVEARKTKSN